MEVSEDEDDIRAKVKRINCSVLTLTMICVAASAIPIFFPDSDLDVTFFVWISLVQSLTLVLIVLYLKQ